LFVRYLGASYVGRKKRKSVLIERKKTQDVMTNKTGK